MPDMKHVDGFSLDGEKNAITAATFAENCLADIQAELHALVRKRTSERKIR